MTIVQDAVYGYAGQPESYLLSNLDRHGNPSGNAPPASTKRGKCA